MASSFTPQDEYREQRIARQRRNRKWARVALLMPIVLYMLLRISGRTNLLKFVNWIESYGFSVELILGVFLILPVILFLRQSKNLWRDARKRAKLAAEVLATDRRAPVVYLRPFEADRRNRWYEKRIATVLKKLGPLVTVGYPDEELPATPWMAREYLLDDVWQQSVLDLIARSQLVVVHVGVSKGLAWEVDQILRHGRPEKLILCLGPDMTPHLVRWCTPAAQYCQFFELYKDRFPKGLPGPTRLSGSVYIAFRPDWTPVLSRELNTLGNEYHTLRNSDPRLAVRLVGLHMILRAVRLWPSECSAPASIPQPHTRLQPGTRRQVSRLLVALIILVLGGYSAYWLYPQASDTALQNPSDFRELCARPQRYFPQAAPYRGAGPHPIEIFERSSRTLVHPKRDLRQPSSDSWRDRFDLETYYNPFDVQLVACLNEPRDGELLGQCRYGSDVIPLYRGIYGIDLYEARGGTKVTSAQVIGDYNTTDCPIIPPWSGTGESKIHTEPDLNEYRRVLGRYVDN